MNKTAVAEIGNHRKPQKDWKETDKRQAYLTRCIENCLSLKMRFLPLVPHYIFRR